MCLLLTGGGCDGQGEIDTQIKGSLHLLSIISHHSPLSLFLGSFLLIYLETGARTWGPGNGARRGFAMHTVLFFSLSSTQMLARLISCAQFHCALHLNM